jgi:hypothetical protein
MVRRFWFVERANRGTRVINLLAYPPLSRQDCRSAVRALVDATDDHSYLLYLTVVTRRYPSGGLSTITNHPKNDYS